MKYLLDYSTFSHNNNPKHQLKAQNVLTMLIPIKYQVEERGWGCTGLLKELLQSRSKQLSKHFSFAEQLTAAYSTHVDYSSLCSSLYEPTVAPENPAREVLFLFRD